MTELQHKVFEINRECSNLKPTSIFNLNIDAEHDRLLTELESLRTELNLARADVFKDENTIDSLNQRMDKEWQALKENYNSHKLV